MYIIYYIIKYKNNNLSINWFKLNYMRKAFVIELHVLKLLWYMIVFVIKILTNHDNNDG